MEIPDFLPQRMGIFAAVDVRKNARIWNARYGQKLPIKNWL